MDAPAAICLWIWRTMAARVLGVERSDIGRTYQNQTTVSKLDAWRRKLLDNKV
jgi:hypothetical protein